MMPSAERVYVFGAFQLDQQSRVLFCEGRQVPLTPKAFDTLLILVENRARVVGKDDLMQAIWPDTFVEETGLTRNISVLRKALGDTTATPRFIATVPKLGYRFIAPVTEITEQASGRPEPRDSVTTAPTVALSEVTSPELPETSPVTIAVSESPVVAHPDSGLPRRWALTAGLVILALSGLALYLTGMGRRSGETGKIKSLAVLPFVLLNTSDRDGYLSAGMADVLINRLSSNTTLNVRPVTAVTRYGREGNDPVAAGRELRVDAVLEGSILKMENKVRVTARMVSVADGRTLWAGDFSDEFADLFVAQDALSERIASAVLLQLLSTTKQPLPGHGTHDAEAYQLYLKGRYCWNKRTPESARRAAGFFEQALARDPHFALSLVGLADTCYFGGSGSVHPNEFFPKAKALVRQALELDETLAEAHTSLAFILENYDWDWKQAEQE